MPRSAGATDRPPLLLRPAGRLAPVRLDPAQQAVVDHPGGPLLVLAGPGTGKTTALVEAVTERVRRGAPVDSLLVLTFSRRAAAELRARICARLDVVTRSPLAVTLHAYAYGLLRREAARVGGPPPRLLSGPEAELTVHRLLAGEAEEGGRAWPEALRGALRTRGFARELTDFLSRALERGLSGPRLASLGEAHGRPDWAAAGRFAARWADIEALHPDGPGLGYAELVARACAVLEDPAAAAEERARVRSVFVDEYQDTDPGQERLLLLLAGGGRDLVAVGDPDQSIYAFRGADVRVLLEFPWRFPRADGAPAPVHALTASRRAGPRLLEASRRVAARLPAPPRGGHRDLTAPADAPHGEVVVQLAASAAEEAALVADALRRGHLVDGLPWEAMAVLVRSVAHSGPLLRRVLGAAGVPVSVAGDEVPLAAEPAARALLLALRAAVDPDRFDEDAAVELATGPLGRVDPLELRRARRTLGRPLAEAVRAGDPELPPSLARVARLVVAARAGAPGGAEAALWATWEAAGVADAWATAALAGGRDGREADQALDAVVALFEAAGRFAQRLPGAGASVFLADVAAQEIPGEASFERAPRAGGVRLCTAHRAKGLEWELVVVAGVQEGSWPDLRPAGSLLGAEALAEAVRGERPSPPALLSAALAEERRLFYVAVTRARRRLVVTAVAGGGEDDERPSRFLDELVGGDVRAAATPPARPLELPALVGELRAVSCDPLRPQHLRIAAARELARLADAGVPGADPAHWYPLVEVSDRAPLLPPGAQVRVSPSAVELFQRCALRWLLERAAGARDATGSAQVVGALVHALAAAVGGAELAGGPVPDRAELAAALDAAWRDADLGAPWYSARLREQALAALDRFLAWRAGNPRRLAAVEQPFSVPGGRAVLDGRVDRLERDAAGRVVVVDLKTSGSPVRGAELDRHAQLGMYQLAAGFGAFGGGGGEPGGAELVQLGKAALAGGARVQRQAALADSAEPGWAGELLERVADGMADAAFPATPGEHCRTCRLAAACPARPEGRRLGEVAGE